jgi:hypothetical protein
VGPSPSLRSNPAPVPSLWKEPSQPQGKLGAIGNTEASSRGKSPTIDVCEASEVTRGKMDDLGEAISWGTGGGDHGKSRVRDPGPGGCSHRKI